MKGQRKSEDEQPHGGPTPARISISRVDMIISVASAFLAILAATTSVWFNLDTRYYYRLTLRPILDFSFDLASTSKPFGVSIANDGTGLGEIKWFQIYIDGQPRDGDREGWEAAIEHLNIKKNWIRYYYFDPGNYVPQDAKIRIFGIATDQAGAEKIDNDKLIEFKSALERLEFAICYCSLYDECWHVRDSFLGPPIRNEVADSCKSRNQ